MANELKTIDLTPTPEGFRTIKEVLEQSISSRQKSIEHLRKIMEQTWDVNWLEVNEGVIGEAIEAYINEHSRSISEMKDTVADLERCGY